MLRKSFASKFNLLIVLSVVISVTISSVSITIFLLHRYNKDVIEKDRLHMKGLASSVKGFIDHAFSLNYLLSINPEIVEHVAAAHKDWSKRVSRIVSDALSGNSGMAENVRLDGQSSTIYYEPIRLPGNESNDHYSLLLIRDNSSLTRAKLTIWMAILFVRFPPGASYS